MTLFQNGGVRLTVIKSHQGAKRAKKSHQSNEAKKNCKFEAGPFPSSHLTRLRASCRDAWVGLYSSRKGFGLCIKFETPRNSVAVKYSKRPDMVQKNVPMWLWYGIVDTVLYIGRMSILVSQGAVARAYCCLLKGLGLSSLGQSLDSYCWDTSRHYQPIVSDGDVKNRFTWIFYFLFALLRYAQALLPNYCIRKWKIGFRELLSFFFVTVCRPLAVIFCWDCHEVDANHIQIFAVSKK